MFILCSVQIANGLNEIALLSLPEAYSLPVLMYVAPALHMSAKQTTELNVCWNMVFRRIFSYNKWESVRAVINGCGRLDVKHLILLRKVKFYRRIFLNNNYVLHKLFCAFLLTGSLYDSCMMSVFAVHTAEKIYVDFRSKMN